MGEIPEGKKEKRKFLILQRSTVSFVRLQDGRECVTYFAQKAEKAGFVNLDTVLEKGTKLAAGDKVYANNMGEKDLPCS